jgi:hypothetical protein
MTSIVRSHSARHRLHRSVIGADCFELALPATFAGDGSREGRGPLAAEMRREEIWLALMACSLMGIAFFYVVARQARLEFAPEIIISMVTLLGLGMSGLAFRGLLKR